MKNSDEMQKKKKLNELSQSFLYRKKIVMSVYLVSVCLLNII